MGSLKDLSKLSVTAFQKLMQQQVTGLTVKGAVATWSVAGVPGEIRIKRAELFANQVHVWWGEPLAVHVPGSTRAQDVWYVLPVSWQLKYARQNAKTAKQHASHAFDCMKLVNTNLPPNFAVQNPASDLRKACEDAMKEAQTKEIRFVVKAIARARDAVADALIATFEDELGNE